MTKLNHITLTQFRCFSRLEMVFNHACNLIIGENGSGKSSILEAIYFLATTRSFRSIQVDSVIQHDLEACAVKGGVLKNDEQIAIHIKKHRGQKPDVFHRNQAIKSIKELSEQLPVSIIHRQSYIQFAKAPEERRRVLDWLLFHVEHSYHTTLRAYNQVLQNRNILLKKAAHPREIKAWTTRLAELGEQIHAFRQPYCTQWFEIFQSMTQEYCSDLNVSLSYTRGWAANNSLDDVFVSNLANDIQRGFTTSGPHRADLKLTVNSEPWERVLSTGQAKTMLFCLFFSQYLVLKEKLGVSPVVLLDDLFADLDLHHAERLLMMASQMDAQFFISSIGYPHEIKSITDKFPSAKLFHVEHLTQSAPVLDTDTHISCVE